MTASSPPAPHIYHERQRRLCCGVHTLNNLFQHHWLEAKAMDEAATRVASSMGSNNGINGLFNTAAYRSVVPFLGNYDILVLLEALKVKKAHFSHHLLQNQRLDADLRELRELLADSSSAISPRVRGIIINRRSGNSVLRWLFDGRHWLALVPIPNLDHSSPSSCEKGDGDNENESERKVVTALSWYDVDSKLPAPVLLGGVDDVVAYVKRQILEEDGQVFVVSLTEE